MQGMGRRRKEKGFDKILIFLLKPIKLLRAGPGPRWGKVIK